jgi:hypothetical protein
MNYYRIFWYSRGSLVYQVALAYTYLNRQAVRHYRIEPNLYLY